LRFAIRRGPQRVHAFKAAATPRSGTEDVADVLRTLERHGPTLEKIPRVRVAEFVE
jgi:hypothetical protein